jgi:hypothetical protein
MHDRQHIAQRDRLESHAADVLQLGIDRHEIILPVDFQPVTGEIDDRHIGIVGAHLKIRERPPQLDAPEIPV